MQGCYTGWFSGEAFAGAQLAERSFTIDEIPLFVLCGSIIPMTIENHHGGNKLYQTYVVRLMQFNFCFSFSNSMRVGQKKKHNQKTQGEAGCFTLELLHLCKVCSYFICIFQRLLAQKSMRHILDCVFAGECCPI